MQDPFTLRPYQPEMDFAALERLIHAVDHANPELLAWSYSLLEVEEFPNHSLEQDRFVLLDRVGELFGYGWIGGPRLERPDLWLCVHPRYRTQGYGNALLERLLLRARERGAGEVTAYIQPNNLDLIRFAAFRGFVRVGYYREFLRMAHLPLGPEGMRSKQASFPKGWTVQSYAELRDPQKVVEAYGRSFGDLWGHNPTTLESQAAWLEQIDPDGLFLLFDESGKVAGNVVATRSSGSELHRLDAPGMVPEHRSAELYAALANLALEWLQNLEQRDVVLESWGDAEEVVAAYVEMGFMEVSRSSYIWRKV